MPKPATNRHRPAYGRANSRMNLRKVVTLLGLCTSACPVYDRGECTSDRSACPEHTSCDIRTGYCVAIDGRQAPEGAPSPREASSPRDAAVADAPDARAPCEACPDASADAGRDTP